MKRRPGESFKDYKIRRKDGNEAFGDRLLRIFRPSSIKKKRAGSLHKAIPRNQASGKRHAGEGLYAFMARRKECNTTRREKEKARKRFLTPEPELIGNLQDVIGKTTSIVPLPDVIPVPEWILQAQKRLESP